MLKKYIFAFVSQKEHA